RLPGPGHGDFLKFRVNVQVFGGQKRGREWKCRWQRQAPQTVACLEADGEELPAISDCSKAHWTRLRTTNVIERLFVEVRRRIRAMCAFTTRDSCGKILFSVFDRM